MREGNHKDVFTVSKTSPYHGISSSVICEICMYCICHVKLLNQSMSFLSCWI